MLTIYIGSDSMGSRHKLAKAIDAEVGTLLRFDELSISEEEFRDSLGSMGLFGGRTIVVLDSVLEKDEAAEYVINSLTAMHHSQNSFYLLSGAVDAKLLKVFEKSGAFIVKSERARMEKKGESGSFALADAFARRDKKSAWVLFMQSMEKETSAQAICATLVWQMRMLVLAHTTESAKEAGVSDFPYRKAKSCIKHFSRRDAEETLRKLVGIYHFDPTLNRGDTAGAIERLILSL